MSMTDDFGSKLPRVLISEPKLKERIAELAREIRQDYEGKEVVAAAWRRLNDLRNRLAHEYPLDRARQTLLVNDAFAAIGPLLEILARTEAYVRTRLPEVAAIPTPRNVP